MILALGLPAVPPCSLGYKRHSELVRDRKPQMARRLRRTGGRWEEERSEFVFGADSKGLFTLAWLHQLYTEWKDNLAELVSKHFPGATISEGTGVWKGKKEKSARIEILTQSKDLASFKALAKLFTAETSTFWLSVVSVLPLLREIY